MSRREENVWNRFSLIYDMFVKKDEKAYKEIIEQTALILKPEDKVLEIATGTGIIALGLCEYIEYIEATDFSPDMIALADKKASQMGISNIHFSVQDAYNLNYSSNSFDAIIICNTLHIMPEPEKALSEIKRVLKQDGKLIAPTFVHAQSIEAGVLSRLMSLTGFRTYNKWTQQSYYDFLVHNGFEVSISKEIKASFPIVYIVANQK